MCLKLNLEQYLSVEKRKARRKKRKRFVLFRRGLAVHRDFRRRLFVLLRIYQKYMIWGVLNLPEVIPPGTKRTHP